MNNRSIVKLSSLVLLSLFAGPRGQTEAQSLPSFPNISIDFFFDDFHYPQTIDSASTNGWSGSDNELPDLNPPDGHLFGENDWLKAAGVDGSYSIENTRAWYNGNWLVYGDQAFGPGYDTGVSGDDSWFDEEGLYITADSAFIYSEYPFLDTLDTGAEEYTPSLLLLRSGAGDYDPGHPNIDITTGFSARTGTWVARMMPPLRDGLSADLRMNPGFWTFSSEFFIDERDTTHLGGDIFKNSNLNTVWTEMNFEFYSPTIDSNRDRFSTGVTWGNTYTSRRDDGAAADANPRIGTNGSTGSCFVDTDDRLNYHDWETWGKDACYDLLSGETFGPLFANYYISIDEDSVHSYIIAWDEDLYHNRPHEDSLGLYDDGFDLMYMNTVTSVTSFVPPRWMKSSFTTNLYNDATIAKTLADDKDLLIDWLFYTPEILSFNSEPDVWDVPGMVSVIRDSLWAYNERSSRTFADQIWRVNNVDFAGETIPIGRPMENGSWNCVDQGGSFKPSYGLDFALHRYKHGSDVFFAPETVVDIANSKYTRHTNLGVEFDIYQEKTPGSNQWLWNDDQSNEGWVYEADVSASPWSSNIEMKIEATVYTYKAVIVNSVTVLQKCTDDSTSLTYYYLPGSNLLSTSYIPTGGGGAKRAAGFVNALHKSYPNPTDGETRLVFELAAAARVRIDLFDITGRHIATLLDEDMGRGRGEVEVDLSGFSQGVYVFRMQAGEFEEFGQLVLVK